jgi:hypothetical protein
MIPGSANPLLLKSAAAAGGLQISRSIRLNSADSAYFSRTPGTAGNRRTWTWSGWVKRSVLGSAQGVFEAGTGSGTDIWAGLLFNSSNQIFCGFANAASNDTYIQSTAVFRDCSAWYHIVLAVDTTNATNTDRVKLYVNNERITVFSDSAYGAQNTDSIMNTTNLFVIGQRRNSSTAYFNGYLANIHFIDGQALDPSSFTETDATTGQLIPKTYTGSYGTNGFNLLFADNSSNTASTLGKDTSGLSNNWTPNNLSVTAGAGNDSLVDSPTNYGTDTGVGGEVRGNYATLNAVDKNSGLTLQNGNLFGTTTTTAQQSVRGTIGVSSGKWYWEVTLDAFGAGNTALSIGIGSNSTSLSNIPGFDATSYGWYNDGGGGSQKSYNNVSVNYGTVISNGVVVGVALDLDTGTITFYRNNTSQGTAYSSIPANTYFPMVAFYNASGTANFGQRAFAYTAPSGFKALNTQNLPATLVTKSNTVMDVALYPGNGGTQSITGLAFSPDLLWIKARSAGYSHLLADSVRGPLYTLQSDSTSVEQSYGCINSFDSAGFTVDLDGTIGANNNGTTFVGWAWDAGTSTVSNPDGSIISQVRANPTAGFSVVKYTTVGSTNSTVGHGLGVAPRLLIVRYINQVSGWYTYHAAAGAGNYLDLQTTGAASALSSLWNNTAPTSTVFSIGTAWTSSVATIAYCFAPVVGYSAALSWTGNGSNDGPMLYCGFTPRFFIAKRTDSANDWWMWDTARSNTGNPVDEWLSPNRSDAEYPNDADFDFLSNGIKIRTTSSSVNASAGTYIGFAWAEMPFNYSRAR